MIAATAIIARCIMITTIIIMIIVTIGPLALLVRRPARPSITCDPGRMIITDPAVRLKITCGLDRTTNTNPVR